MLLNEGFDIDTPANSIFMLWTMIQNFDSKQPLLSNAYTTSKSDVVNPKVNLWSGYSEALVGKAGAPVSTYFYGKNKEDFESATEYLQKCANSNKYYKSFIFNYLS